MKAAIVEQLGKPPAYGDFQEPVAGEGETVVQVEAAPLSPIVKRLAAGTHYASSSTAGFVPGVDGIGIDSEGRRVYFLFPKAPFGSMAERSLVARAMTVPIPESLSAVEGAALATGGLASWIALTRRARLQGGETVLVNGATGSAGSMALQIARYLGATKVIAVGRNAAKLADMDADVKIALSEDAEDRLREQFKLRVDVVLDFLWGEPALQLLQAATHGRGGRMGEPRLRFVQLGTIAGEAIPVRGDMLRSSGLELIGSGIGSVAVAELLAGTGEMLAAAPAAGFHASGQGVPLASVAEIWNSDTDTRYILTPRVA